MAIRKLHRRVNDVEAFAPSSRTGVAQAFEPWTL